MKLVFPLTIIVMMFCASVTYIATGDWRRAIFWAAAAVINLVSTV